VSCRTTLRPATDRSKIQGEDIAYWRNVQRVSKPQVYSRASCGYCKRWVDDNRSRLNAMLIRDNGLFQKDVNLKPISQWLMVCYQMGKNDPMSQG
jgi:hypothetical protein